MIPMAQNKQKYRSSVDAHSPRTHEWHALFKAMYFFTILPLVM